jgi:hypothetical protein
VAGAEILETLAQPEQSIQEVAVAVVILPTVNIMQVEPAALV